MKLLVACVCGALTVASSAFAQDTRSDEAALRKADIAWANSAQTKSVDIWVANYSDDAVVLSPNQPAAAGSEAIRNSISGLLGLPGLQLTWQPIKVEVSRSGDMGYIRGAYQLSFDGGNGTRISDHGKYIEIWKKQADGRWKCTIDMFNSDVPASQ